MTQTTLDHAIAERDAAIEQVEESAGVVFRKQAQGFIVAYLHRHVRSAVSIRRHAPC